MDDKKKVLIADWHRRCRQSQRLNYVTGNIYLKYHYIVGIVSIVLSAIVSSTFFTQINQQAVTQQAPSIAITIITYAGGSLSILVAILSALQTFFRFSEKSEKYKLISAKYGAIRRQLELLMTQEEISKNELERQLESIRKSMDDLAMNSLNIPERVKKAQVKDLNSQARKNGLFTEYDKKGDKNE